MFAQLMFLTTANILHNNSFDLFILSDQLSLLPIFCCHKENEMADMSPAEGSLRTNTAGLWYCQCFANHLGSHLSSSSSYACQQLVSSFFFFFFFFFGQSERYKLLSDC
jgi:hypothetical protein